jgi:hypothetical protein
MLKTPTKDEGEGFIETLPSSKLVLFIAKLED